MKQQCKSTSKSPAFRILLQWKPLYKIYIYIYIGINTDCFILKSNRMLWCCFRESLPVLIPWYQLPETAEGVRVLASGGRKSMRSSFSSQQVTTSRYVTSHSPVSKHLISSDWTETTNRAAASTDSCQASFVSIHDSVLWCCNLLLVSWLMQH